MSHNRSNQIVSVLFLSAAVIVITVALLSHWRNSHPPAQAATYALPPAAIPTTAAARPAGNTPPASAVDVHQRPPEPGTVELAAGQVVATINGKPLLARDVIPFPSDDPNARQTVSRSQYKFALEHAIDRELVFDAASRQDVNLTDDNWAQLEQLRQSALAQSKSNTDALVEFQLRETAGNILLSSLLAKEGLTPPAYSDAEVRQYYDAHPGYFDKLPQDPSAQAAAWAKISAQVRDYLSINQRAAYHEKIRAFLDQLRSRVPLTVVDLPSDA
jgi:hypothetical protein